MLEIVEILKEKHYTNTKAMTNTLSRCLHCGAVFKILHQNVMKHNRMGRKHCLHCLPETFHKMTDSRIWRIWQGLRWRTRDRSDKNYGGRGISVSPEWEDFSRFYEDMRHGYSDDLTIDRIDPNGPYSKENCRWVTNMEQQANKRNNRRLVYKGESIHLAELCRRTGIGKVKLVARLDKGMTPEEAVEDALKTPARVVRKRSLIWSTADQETASSSAMF